MGEPAARAGSAASTPAAARPAGGSAGSSPRSSLCVLAVVCVCWSPRLGHRVPAVHGRGRHLGAGQLPRRHVAGADDATSASASARSPCEFPDVEFISVQAGRNDSGTDPFPPSRMEIMIGPQAARASGQQFTTKQELVARLGQAAARGVPDDALQLHPADHRQRDRGHQRHLGQPGRRVHRARLGRAARTGPPDRRAAEAQSPARRT